MHAAMTPTYGPPEILQLTDVPEPTMGPRDIRVQVHASPITAGDRRLRSADFPGLSALPGRLLLGITAPRHPIQGTMYAGRVIAVGADVTRFQVGDDVFGGADHGAWAERIVVAEDSAVALIPAGVGYTQAASVPYGAGTALHFLRDLAALTPGEKILILGASGGVGRYAIQVAKHLGAEVTAVSSPEAFDLTRSLGADHVLDHRSQDFTTAGVQYDVIFDIADASSFRHSRNSLTPNGRYLTLYISLVALFTMGLTALIGGRRSLFSVAMGTQAQTEDLADLLGQGLLRAVVAHQIPLARLIDAHTLAEQGVHGEVLILPTPQVNSLGSAAAGRLTASR